MKQIFEKKVFRSWTNNKYWIYTSLKPNLTGAFLNRQTWAGGGGGLRALHHNFFVIAPMIMRFGTCIKFDVFYRMVTKKFVTSLLLRNYDVITCILADV